jgi:hypothetical protein
MKTLLKILVVPFLLFFNGCPPKELPTNISVSIDFLDSLITPTKFNIYCFNLKNKSNYYFTISGTSSDYNNNILSNTKIFYNNSVPDYCFNDSLIIKFNYNSMDTVSCDTFIYNKEYIHDIHFTINSTQSSLLYGDEINNIKSSQFYYDFGVTKDTVKYNYKTLKEYYR